MGRRRKKETPFRKLLCEFMAQSDLSVREAAKIAGVPTSTIANWRGGATPDDHMALRRLADHFGTTLGYLLTGEPDTASAPRLSEAFTLGAPFFDGYARLTIQPLAPRPGVSVSKRRLAHGKRGAASTR